MYFVCKKLQMVVRALYSLIKLQIYYIFVLDLIFFVCRVSFASMVEASPTNDDMPFHFGARGSRGVRSPRVMRG